MKDFITAVLIAAIVTTVIVWLCNVPAKLHCESICNAYQSYSKLNNVSIPFHDYAELQNCGCIK